MTNLPARLLLVAATLAVAACTAADSTAPRALNAPRVAAHDDVTPDSIPNSSCRSGYSLPNGRCTGV